MEELDTIEIIKRIFLNKKFVYTFLVSLFSIIIFLVVGLGLVWYFRADVFSYFAKEYVQKMQNPKQSY